MALKMAILAIAIGSSTMPLHNVDVNKAIVSTKVAEVASQEALQDIDILNNMKATTAGHIKSEDVMPLKQPENLGKMAPVKEALPGAQLINEDKTYEECMREAFERIYAKINRMLNEVVDKIEK